MDEVSPKKQESILNSLMETLTCPVCLETIRKDSIQCVNGHAMCKECQGEQSSCPTCREVFVDVRHNLIVRQVLDIVSVACKFEGCGYLVKSGGDHETCCIFRPLICKQPECNWTGRADKLFAHVKENHPQNVLSVIEEWFNCLSM